MAKRMAKEARVLDEDQVSTLRGGAVRFDLAAARAESVAEEAERAASEAESNAAAAVHALYDQYSLREIQNATALSGFRRRKSTRPTPEVVRPDKERGKTIVRLDGAAEVSDVRANALREEAERIRQAVTKKPAQVPNAGVLPAIRQGVKAAVETVPMPVRLEVTQVALLKLLAAFEGTTASAIIRECIASRLELKVLQDKAFAEAAKAKLSE